MLYHNRLRKEGVSDFLVPSKTSTFFISPLTQLTYLEAPSKLVTSTGKGLPDHPSPPTPAAAAAAPVTSAAATSEDVGGGGSNNTPTAAADNIASATGGSGNFEDADGGIPGYITEAAAIIATALSLEADQQFEESIAAYRSAIGRLNTLCPYLWVGRF